MSFNNHNPIVTGEPNWVPLERVLLPRKCEDYMYVGRVGNIELYKHRWTRRYLNISSDGRRFYRQVRDTYIEISRTDAMKHVRS